MGLQADLADSVAIRLTAAVGLQSDSLLPPFAWRFRSFPKHSCKQELHSVRAEVTPPSVS